MKHGLIEMDEMTVDSLMGIKEKDFRRFVTDSSDEEIIKAIRVFDSSPILDKPLEVSEPYHIRHGALLSQASYRDIEYDIDEDEIKYPVPCVE